MQGTKYRLTTYHHVVRLPFMVQMHLQARQVMNYALSNRIQQVIVEKDGDSSCG